ncbi:hypothetical protein [Ectopseudomonas mendocina]|uniref:Transmembrane protein n=1 Tax=Ectopseudomonas mendocina S5.2 TaxID=1225174 RepID=A0ABM5VVA7_ECTME|nr:hypothetical protein [Pseudomonas mendocina]ALN18777.1 hypothetical protein DW68_009075 [Pseudomonas mendocina S5.2]KES00370.1 hypothetical protein HN51_11115 [Pseudomonas mendocina]
MTVSFRAGRYLVALLWHWITPFLFGAIAATLVALVGLKESVQAIGNAFETAIANVAEQCTTSDPANATDAEPVKGRAPGSSDHASPIRRTEARAERTLEHPPP